MFQMCDLLEGSCPLGALLSLGSFKSSHLLEIEQTTRTAEATPPSSNFGGGNLEADIGCVLGDLPPDAELPVSLAQAGPEL